MPPTSKHGSIGGRSIGPNARSWPLPEIERGGSPISRCRIADSRRLGEHSDACLSLCPRVCSHTACRVCPPVVCEWHPYRSINHPNSAGITSDFSSESLSTPIKLQQHTERAMPRPPLLHHLLKPQRQRQQLLRRLPTTRATTFVPTAGNATVTGPRPLAPTAFSRYVSEPRRVQSVGAPLADGQPLLGVDMGPTFIRTHGLVERLVRACVAVQFMFPPHDIDLSINRCARAAGACGCVMWWWGKATRLIDIDQSIDVPPRPHNYKHDSQRPNPIHNHRSAMPGPWGIKGTWTSRT